MKKVLLFCFSFTLLFSLPTLGQQKDQEKSNGNSDNGRVNLLLPHGNIGINTLSPTERLEVIGNVRISDALFVKETDMLSLTTTNISVREDVSVGRNLSISGNVGIGVQQPSERLEIGGNLRVTQKIFAEEAEVNAFTGNSGTVNQSLLVGQNFNVNGLTGMGIAAPAERLEVAGNIRVTETIISQGIKAETGEITSSFAVHENLVVNGSSGFGVESPVEKLEVAGNIKSSGNFLGQELEVEQGSFSKDVQIGQNLIVAGNADFTGSVGMQSLNISGSIETSSFQADKGNFSGSFSAAGPVALWTVQS
jgi:cytoskeletal protein CcmA (bactofilin family)